MYRLFPFVEKICQGNTRFHENVKKWVVGITISEEDWRIIMDADASHPYSQQDDIGSEVVAGDS